VTLVALSASYGAGGSRVGPEVAKRLGVPFLDRVIPMAVAQRMDVPFDEAVAHDERMSSSWLERMLSSFVALDTSTPTPVVAEAFSADEFRRTTEAVIVEQAQTGGGVILGRGAAVLLRDDRRVLRVRLDGPPEFRVRQAMALQGLDEETARQGLPKLDRTHAAYLRHFYNADINDPGLYNLMIDSTSIPLGVCAELIVRAAESMAGAASGG
jgi:cytidylate kinase